MSYLVGTTEDDINENDIDFEELENLDTTSIIDRLRGLASYSRRSPQEKRAFKALAERQTNRQVSLLLDVKTRWNSTYYMGQRAIDMKDVIETYLAGSPRLKQKFELTPSEWLVVDEILSSLKPMAAATVFLSRSKYPSLGATLPIYSALIEVYKFIS